MGRPTKVDEILLAAQGLSDRDRTEVALRLLDTVDPPDPQAGLDDKAWVTEVERRSDEVLSGRVKTIPWSRAKAGLTRKRSR